MRIGVKAFGTLTSLLLLSIPAVAHAQDDKLLPPGPGRAIVVQKCGLCHSLKNLLSAGKQTRTFWEETVDEMYYEAAWPKDTDRQIIIDYLVATLGKPEDAVATPAASSAPAQPGPADRAKPQNDLRAVVENSMKAMGVEQVRTMVISGEGVSGAVGQSFNPHSPWWRKFSNKNYVRSIDFEKKGWRIQSTVGEGENPPGGGAGRITPAPNQTQNTVIAGGARVSTLPVRGQGIEARAPDFSNQIEYAMLPLGFLKMALEKNATVKSDTVQGKRYTVLTFPMEHRAPSGGFHTTVSGWINEQGYVEKVSTIVDNIVLGDIVWDAVYTDWKDFGGVKVPTRVVQHQGDPIFFDLTISDVKVNVPVDLTPPAGTGEATGGGGGEAGAATVTSEDLGDGAWRVLGGLAGVVVSFKDHLVVIEGPQNDMRADQIISEAKRLVPNKPIRYVINTHAHFDHAGGLRAFVAEGATILTHEGNKSYYEKIFANAHTLVPDKLSKMSPQPAIKVEYVGDKKVLTDGSQTLELYRLLGSTHNAFMLMAYLPKQKILVEADEFNVPAVPLQAPPARINSYETNLLVLIEQLKLNVERIVPVHQPADNRKVALTELKLAAGKP